MGRIIALLTDFGTTDTYVGVMKGVMLGICPDATFVDLTHAIEPQNIRQAAFALLNSYRFFPPDTIFLVVVDPGVGSERRPIAARAGDFSFVAPDNGVLSYVLRELGEAYTVELTKHAYQVTGMSNTFHGRDIFAPAAADLAAGAKLWQMGSTEFRPVMLPEPKLISRDTRITGEVLHIDHFGSVVTSIGLLSWGESRQLTLTPRFEETSLMSFAADQVVVAVGAQKVTGIRRTYAEAERDAALALVGSSSYLELAVNGSNFAERFGVKIGDPVELQIG